MAASRLLALLPLQVLAAAGGLTPGVLPARYGSMGGDAATRSALLGATASASSAWPQPRFATQRQDHFDGSNAKTWKQAYYVNDTFWKAGSSAPVFLCVGGEGPPMDGSTVVDSVHCNVAVEWLRETGALMFALEHRYYGCHNSEACPVANLSEPGALRFHSSRQALGDVAGFVEYATQEFALSSANRWVTFGGSYPGMLAGWARLKFPHLIHASVSSSAPVRAELEMRGYNDVVAQAYAVAHERVGGSPSCRQAIAEGHRKIGDLFSSEQGRGRLATLFGQAAAWYAEKGNQVGFAGQGVAQFPAQSNDPTCDEAMCNIAKICAEMTNVSIGDEVQRLAEVRCMQAEAAAARRFASPVRAAKTPTPGYGNGDQLWAWQTCTEFGFYQTCVQGSQCFYTQGLATLDEEMSFCGSMFNIPNDVVTSNIAYSNAYYGADHPQGSRVLYVNGEVDPWHANSINAPLAPELPALYVAGASHHAWTHPSVKSDQDSVVAVRAKIRAIVGKWLAEPADEATVTLRI